MCEQGFQKWPSRFWKKLCDNKGIEADIRWGTKECLPRSTGAPRPAMPDAGQWHRRARHIHRFPDFDKVPWIRLFNVTSQRVISRRTTKRALTGLHG